MCADVKFPPAKGTARRIVPMIGVMIILAAPPLESFGRPTTFERSSNGLYNVGCFTDSLYQALGHGAMVYRGNIVGYKIANPDARGIQYGSITFDITRTLSGKSRPRILLPFSRLRPGASNSGVYHAIWPDPADLVPGAELCIVVVPDAFDQSADLVPGVTVAASHVFIGDHAPVEAFGFMERICAIERTKAEAPRDKLLSELQKSTLDKHPEVRSFASEMLIGDILDDSPAEVIQLLRGAVVHWKENGVSSDEMTGMIAQFGQLVRDKQLPIKTRTLALRTIGLLMLETGDELIRLNAGNVLAYAVSSTSFDTPTMTVTRAPNSALGIKVGEAFSKGEITQLRGMVAKLPATKLGSGPISIARWLDSGE